MLVAFVFKLPRLLLSKTLGYLPTVRLRIATSFFFWRGSIFFELLCLVYHVHSSSALTTRVVSVSSSKYFWLCVVSYAVEFVCLGCSWGSLRSLMRTNFDFWQDPRDREGSGMVRKVLATFLFHRDSTSEDRLQTTRAQIRESMPTRNWRPALAERSRLALARCLSFTKTSIHFLFQTVVTTLLMNYICI